jgi:hypothetical protein
MRSSTWDHDFSPPTLLHIYHLPHTIYVTPSPSHSPSFHRRDNIQSVPQPRAVGIINQKTKWATGENLSEYEKRQKVLLKYKVRIHFI